MTEERVKVGKICSSQKHVYTYYYLKPTLGLWGYY